MGNEMKEGSRKSFAQFIRKCLESQKEKEFILKIPLRKGASDSE